MTHRDGGNDALRQTGDGKGHGLSRQRLHDDRHSQGLVHHREFACGGAVAEGFRRIGISTGRQGNRAVLGGIGVVRAVPHRDVCPVGATGEGNRVIDRRAEIFQIHTVVVAIAGKILIIADLHHVFRQNVQRKGGKLRLVAGIGLPGQLRAVVLNREIVIVFLTGNPVVKPQGTRALEGQLQRRRRPANALVAGDKAGPSSLTVKG